MPCLPCFAKPVAPDGSRRHGDIAASRQVSLLDASQNAAITGSPLATIRSTIVEAFVVEPGQDSQHGAGSSPVAGSPKRRYTSLVDRAAQTNDTHMQCSGLAAAETASCPSLPKKWKKGESIGSGSFGSVFLGLNGDTGELLAVKEVAMNMEGSRLKEAVAQLEREVALLSTLAHPNIVKYIGTSREDQCLYIFLEYVPGGSIASLLARFGPLEENVIRIYTRQILSGLAYLHLQRTVHRDIKGANLLVEKNGRIKLADFGMAKQMVEQMSFTKSFKGSAFWMAPEVIRQQGHGVAADIWSVGCTVLEMATGKPPWAQCSTQVQAIFKIASSPELPAIPETLSPEASEFVLLCLQRDPLARPSAEQLLQHPFVTIQDKSIPALLGTEQLILSMRAPAPQQHKPGAGDGMEDRAVDIPGAVSDGAGDGSAPQRAHGTAARLAGGPPLGRHAQEPSSAQQTQDDAEYLAAMLLGSAAAPSAGHGSRGLLAAKPAGASWQTATNNPTSSEGMGEFSTQPQQFRVRGLLTLPPLRVPHGEKLAAVTVTPLHAS